MSFLARLISWFKIQLWQDTIVEGGGWLKRLMIQRVRSLYFEVRFFFDGRIMQAASALAFTTILSLIPLLAVMFLVFKLFDGRNILANAIKPQLFTLMAPGAGEELAEALDTMLQSASVETLGVVGFVFLLGSVYMMFNSVEESINKIWNIQKNRGFGEQLKSYGVVLVAVPFFTVISLVVTGYVRELGESLIGGFSMFFGETLFPFFMVVLAFYSLNRVMPNCKVKGSKAWYGAIVGAVLFLVSKEVFVYYTTLAVSTNLIYGSLAALPIFFLWLYIIWIIVLFSVLVVYIQHNLEHLTALERSKAIGRADELKLGIMTAMILADNSLNPENKSPGSSINEMADLIGSPARDVRMIINRLERANLLVRVAGKDERFLLRTSPERFSLGILLDALDQVCLGENHYRGQAAFPVYARLFKENRLKLQAYRRLSLAGLIELNRGLLAETPESDLA